MFKLSKASQARLATVNMALQNVVNRAIQITEVDFGVVQGNRTRADQEKLYGQGRTAAQMKAAGLNPALARPDLPVVTKTMNSNHIGGRAVDLAPYVNGKIEWDNSGKLGLYPKIAKAMKQAAKELGVPIEWGGDWTSFKDRPHFELKRP
jgi:peptidoglycan L-alanyl-D-glutamate endopeptidase CwlK